MAKYIPRNSNVEQLKFDFLNINHAIMANALINIHIIKLECDIVGLNEPCFQKPGVPRFQRNMKVTAGGNNPRSTIVLINRD